MTPQVGWLYCDPSIPCIYQITELLDGKSYVKSRVLACADPDYAKEGTEMHVSIGILRRCTVGIDWPLPDVLRDSPEAGVKSPTAWERG